MGLFWMDLICPWIGRVSMSFRIDKNGMLMIWVCICALHCFDGNCFGNLGGDDVEFENGGLWTL